MKIRDVFIYSIVIAVMIGSIYFGVNYQYNKTIKYLETKGYTDVSCKVIIFIVPPCFTSKNRLTYQCTNGEINFKLCSPMFYDNDPKIVFN